MDHVGGLVYITDTESWLAGWYFKPTKGYVRADGDFHKDNI